MIPVYQTMTVANDGQGNCFNACIASILELPLSEVAQIHPKDQRYWGAWDEWLESKGLELHIHSATAAPLGYSIAFGFGDRAYPEGHEKAGETIGHAVVCFNGTMVHDPYPLGGLFGGTTQFLSLQPIDAGRGGLA